LSVIPFSQCAMRDTPYDLNNNNLNRFGCIPHIRFIILVHRR
jgi:hypothetical protein